MNSTRFAAVVLLSAIATASLITKTDAAQTRAYVFSTDYTTGILNTVELDDRAVALDVADDVCGDARVRWHDGRLYLVNRLGCDNVIVLDGATLGFVRQFSVGNGSNPSDILVLSPIKAYVARYDSASILVVNPQTGATTGRIDLSPFADADGLPEMDRLIRVGARVFVSIQRLDRNAGFSPTDHSDVVVIDPATDAIVDADPSTVGTQPIRLTVKNPVTAFAFDPATQRLLIGCTGAYGVVDGGIEWVDPVALASAGLAITGAALGGDLGDVVWNGAAHSYAIVTDAGPPFDARLVSWSASSGQVIGTVFSPGAFALPDAEANDRGELYVCDNAFTNPGLFVFSTANDAMIAGPLWDAGASPPPNQVTFDQGSNVTGVDALVPAVRVRMRAPNPNPARDGVRIRFDLDSPGSLRLEVFDLSGRSVGVVAHREFAAGENQVHWDLSTASGSRVRPGIYLIRATLDRDFVRRIDAPASIIRVAVIN